MQPSDGHLDIAAIADKQTCPSETDILFGNEPSFPFSLKSAPAGQDTAKTPVVTESMIRRLLQKQYQHTLYADAATTRDKDVNLRSSKNENSGVSMHKYLSLINNAELFPNRNKTKSYDISKYTEKSSRKQNDTGNYASGMMGHTPKPNVLEIGSSLNVEERTRLVQKIYLELNEWRQKQCNTQAVQCDDKMCIPNVRNGRNDSKKWHQNVVVSDDLSITRSKDCETHWRQHEVPSTNDGSSSGSHCK